VPDDVVAAPGTIAAQDKLALAPEPSPSQPNRFLKRLGEYKEFIAIIVAMLGGVWFAVDYFVTQKRFTEEMVITQCSIFANIAKVNRQINNNYYQYMRDKIYSQIFELQQKSQKESLTMKESREMRELQDSLDALKKTAEASSSLEAKYDEALQTNSCAALIKVSS
jgi:hypothetical protein